jgi:hypothetical protein
LFCFELSGGFEVSGVCAEPVCANACTAEGLPGRHRKAIAAEATRVERKNVIELNLSKETGVSKLPGRQIPVQLRGPASAVWLSLM